MNRSSQFTENQNLIRSLSFSIVQVLRFFFDWISTLPLLFSTLIWIPLYLTIREKVQTLNHLWPFHPAYFSISLPMLIFICVFPAYWATNVLGQHRTINIAYFAFLLFWFLNITVWTNYLANKKLLPPFRLNTTLYVIVFVLIGGALALTKNGYHTAVDIIYGNAKQYDRQMMERYQLLKAAQNDDHNVAYLTPIKNKPHSIFILDIHPNPSYWVNAGYARYYGLKRVIRIE